MEIFGFAREMSGQTAQLVGQIQAQAEVQRQDAKQREEAQRVEVQAQRAEVQAQRADAQAQRAEAKQREEAQRAEARQREEMLIQMKIATEQALRKEKWRPMKPHVNVNSSIWSMS